MLYCNVMFYVVIFLIQIYLYLCFLHNQILQCVCEGSKHRFWHTIEGQSMFTSCVTKLYPVLMLRDNPHLQGICNLFKKTIYRIQRNNGNFSSLTQESKEHPKVICS